MFSQIWNACLSGFSSFSFCLSFFFPLCGPSVLSKNRRVLRLSVHSPSSFATLPGSSSLCQCLSCRTKKNAGKSKSLSVNSFMTHCSKKQVGSQKERHFLKNRDLFPRQLGFWEMPSVMSAAFAKSLWQHLQGRFQAPKRLSSLFVSSLND